MRIISLILTLSIFGCANPFSKDKDKPKEENRIIKTINANNITVGEIHCIEELVFIRDLKNSSFVQVLSQNGKPLKCEEIKTDDKEKDKDKEKKK